MQDNHYISLSMELVNSKNYVTSAPYEQNNRLPKQKELNKEKMETQLQMCRIYTE